MGKEFQTIVAAAPQEKLVWLDKSESVSIAVGATKTIDIFAPPGTICTVKNVFLNLDFPVGAANGTHTLYVKANTPYGSYLAAIAPFNGKIILSNFVWTDSGGPMTTKDPANGSIASAIANIQFDDTTSFQLQYINNTNVVSGAANRSLGLIYVQRTTS